MHFTRLYLLALVCFLITSVSHATLFNEKFESDLSEWAGKQHGSHNGVIVNDPLRPANNVLSFSDRENGGDIFHSAGVELNIGLIYELSFEYLGLEISGVSVPDDFGGFLGMSDIVDNPMQDKTWIFGTPSSYPDLRGHLIDDGAWHTYSYIFEWKHSEIGATDDIVHIMMEDWISSGGSHGDVYFDNIKMVMFILIISN